MPIRPGEIVVYCAASPKHPKKRPEVVVLAFIYRGLGLQGDGPRWQAHVRSPRLQRADAGGKAGQSLADDRRFRYDAKKETFKEAEFRSSWKLECPFCRVNVAFREDKLFAVLDGLREYGVGRVELGAVAATMSNMT